MQKFKMKKTAHVSLPLSFYYWLYILWLKYNCWIVLLKAIARIGSEAVGLFILEKIIDFRKSI